MQTAFVRSKAGIIAVLAILLALACTTTVLAATAADFEGKTITSVTAEGNKVVVTDDIMRAIKAKTGDKFTAAGIKQDMQAVYDLGYFYDVSVTFTDTPEGVKVVYKITENPSVTDISITGNTVFSTLELMNLMQVDKGAVLNSVSVAESVQAIENHYRSKGFMLAKVVDTSLSPNGLLSLKINEGLLEGFKVKGNDKTKENVILREMRMKPGQVFNSQDAKRSMQRVYNLGFFEDVNMKLIPGTAPNAVILETDVKEQKTGTLSIGGGYSSTNGLVGMIEVGDTNFRGTGDQVKVHYEFGGKAGGTNYSFGYTRPYLDSKQTSIGFNIYNMTSRRYAYDNRVQEAEYDERRHGWNISLGRPLDEYTKAFITFKEDKSSNMETISERTAGWLKDPNNIRFGLTRSVTLSGVYDSRDNVFNATEGSRLALSTEFAGRMFGGDVDFSKYTLDARTYKDAGNSGKNTWAFKANVGILNGDTPSLSDQFVIGGSETLRGYEEGEFRGDKMFTFTTEYRFPLLKKVQGVAFVDTGKAWKPGEDLKLDDVKIGYGAGIRVSTPIGPIKLDYARGSEGGKFHFSFGGSF